MPKDYVQEVKTWWREEIEPWKSIIVGCVGHEAKRYDYMSNEEQWLYQKCSFGVHYFYQGMAPPPQPTWEAGIYDVTSLEAQQWFKLEVSRKCMMKCQMTPTVRDMMRDETPQPKTEGNEPTPMHHLLLYTCLQKIFVAGASWPSRKVHLTTWTVCSQKPHFGLTIK